MEREHGLPPEKEALAVVWALSFWINYLAGKPFTVVTDHSALTYIIKVNPKHISKVSTSERIARWQMALMALDFTAEHRPGASHSLPDYMSRPPELDEEKSTRSEEPQPFTNFPLPPDFICPPPAYLPECAPVLATFCQNTKRHTDGDWAWRERTGRHHHLLFEFLLLSLPPSRELMMKKELALACVVIRRLCLSPSSSISLFFLSVSLFFSLYPCSSADETASLCLALSSSASIFVCLPLCHCRKGMMKKQWWRLSVPPINLLCFAPSSLPLSKHNSLTHSSLWWWKAKKKWIEEEKPNMQKRRIRYKYHHHHHRRHHRIARRISVRWWSTRQQSKKERKRDKRTRLAQEKESLRDVKWRNERKRRERKH